VRVRTKTEATKRQSSIYVVKAQRLFCLYLQYDRQEEEYL